MLTPARSRSLNVRGAIRRTSLWRTFVARPEKRQTLLMSSALEPIPILFSADGLRRHRSRRTGSTMALASSECTCRAPPSAFLSMLKHPTYPRHLIGENFVWQIGRPVVFEGKCFGLGVVKYCFHQFEY